MIKKRFFIQLFLSIIFCSSVFATGPSYIDSKIRPISINEMGEILCRTRFTKNEMGAHKAMKITYGYCIITSDSIIQKTTQEIEPDGFPDYDTYTEFVTYWDSIFNSEFDKENLSEIGYLIKKQFRFDSYNVASYKIDKIQTISKFSENKRIDIIKTKQWALNGAKNTEYFDSKMIHVLYDFGNVLILENVNNEFEEIQIGADFDYYNPWINKAGETENIGFDLSEITGVLMIIN